MAKKKSKGSAKARTTSEKKKKNDEVRITMEALEAMSDSDDDNIPESQWNTKAKSLREAINDGKFDHLIDKLKNNNDDDDEIEEASLHSGSSDEEVDAGEGENNDGDEKQDVDLASDGDDDDSDNDDDDEEEGDAEGNSDDEDEDDASESEEESEEDEKMKRMKANNHFNSKALSVATAELVASHSHLPWAETFDVIPSTPLPFSDNGDQESNPLDIHDDLKREVAFYNHALEAVNEARTRCKQAKIPFSRPEDFFAEMVKTDDHMAKVKDRLIFENKKMEAVAQRKSNREQKLRAKESHANKLAEKAKRKRDHFQQVEEWANSAAQNRGGALDDDADERFLNRANNKKRQRADKKFGFGGKKGRFKQNSRESMNDMSGFNPRGNFPGGMKKTAKNGSGAGRQGKRARDANRARRG